MLFYLLISSSIFSQNNPENNYKEFDAIVGTISNDLSQGIRFVDAYNKSYTIDDFRFYNSDAFAPAYLMYNHQPFYNINLKYDVLEDDIIFRNKIENNFEIKLSSLHISAFTIHETTFLKLPQQVSKFSFYKNGFFEQLYKGEKYDLYVKHQKSKKKRLGEKAILYEFIDTKNILLKYNSEYYELISKNDVLKILPNQKEFIKSFYTNNKILRKQNLTAFMVSLFRYLETK